MSNYTPWQGKEYWNRRVEQFGHTGWAHPVLYKYDQKTRVDLIDKLAKVDPQSRILDFGCGTGEMIKALVKRYPQSQITGVDVSDKVIDIAKKNLNAFKNVDFFSDGIDSPKLMAGSFDLILCITVLQHFEPNHLTHAFKRLTSLLRPNGRIIILENIYQRPQSNNYINTSFGESSWREVIAASGLQVIRTTSYPHWGVLAVETALPLFRNLREELRTLIGKNTPNITPTPADQKVIRAASDRSMTSLLIKFLLALTWPLDHLLCLPPPRCLRHYTMFVITKK